MAQKVSVETIDDLDGVSTADATVSFTFDGVGYEIDLSSANADKFRNDIAVWIGHSRVVGKSAGRGRKSGGEDLAAIRSWAQSQGIAVAMRGRVSGDIVAQYHKRNSDKSGKSVADRAAANRVAAVTGKAVEEAATLPEFSSSK